jgi:thioesterase domain-containing protein
MFDRVPGVMKSRLATSTFEAPSNLLDTQGIPLERALMRRLSRIAGESCHPRPLDAPGVLVRAKFPGEDWLPGHDFKSGWGELFTQGLEVVQARGEHVSMVADENAASLRRQINAVLDERDWDDGKRIAI